LLMKQATNTILAVIVKGRGNTPPKVKELVRSCTSELLLMQLPLLAS
jgi:hypothetical protein